MAKPQTLVFLASEDWHFVSHRLPLAQAAMAEGYAVTVITRQTQASEALTRAGIRVIGFEMQRDGVGPLQLLAEARRLAEIYSQIKPDLVHHIALRPVIIGAIAARLAGVSQVVSSITGLGFLFTQRRLSAARLLVQVLLPRLLKRSTTIVQNTDDHRFFLSLGFKPDQLYLVPGVGVDLDAFSPGEADAPPVVMLPCRLLREKGVYEFLEAARLLRNQVMARFVVVGAPDYGNPGVVPEAEVMKCVAEGVIEWWGHSTDMPATLRRATVVCLPSYREGFPKVLAEAMACGKPCIASDVPGCRDAVVHEKTGLLVRERDTGALCAAIQSLLSQPTRLVTMGLLARQHATMRFSNNHMNTQITSLYRNLQRIQPFNLGGNTLTP